MSKLSLPDGILRTACLVHYGLINIFPTSEKEKKTIIIIETHYN